MSTPKSRLFERVEVFTRATTDALNKAISEVLDARSPWQLLYRLSRIVFLGQDWQDALFWVLAAVMLGSGLLVVTMRDIIRCGLAMIVCFGALAGIYVLIGAPLIGAAQVIVYIGAISVLILFAIMLTQTKDAPARLVFQTQAGGAAIASLIIGIVIALSVIATDWPGAVSERIPVDTARMAKTLFEDFALPLEIVVTRR